MLDLVHRLYLFMNKINTGKIGSLFYFFFFLVFSRAAPAAYRGS